ncbi:helix-turn-helix domain-containing protein [Muricauda sp. SCSIO 64092]|uniref:helix-turn-helix domain-containing protein n=1 Tax=Allomuricauda sp. SCSIO 64092 TaxID=2908842 RepID=UPI001FF6A70C|nr:helix-turn-helix domain-containing protein [Muricauda sp. SCSIO 64092]UOY08286.1 helix-turn-helix domain-containing protein [Muricauda sp. SCSIO 64092]
MKQEPSISTHTLNDIVNILGDTPQEKNGLHVHFTKKRLDVIPLTYPHKGDSYSFLLVVSGAIKIQLNLITYTVQCNEVIVMKPQMVIHVLDMDHNLEMIVVSFTIDFIMNNFLERNEFEAWDFFTNSTIPKLKLSGEETESAIALSKLLLKNNATNTINIPFRNRIINYTFGLLLHHYSSIFKRDYPDLEIHLSRQEKLTLQFLKILNENFKTERSVQFYADALYMTSGHLSKVLKQVSGKTAGQLIDDAVIMEAKILLAAPELTVAQIANELQFSDQSFFGKYFKKHTGLPPSKFRRQAKLA